MKAIPFNCIIPKDYRELFVFLSGNFKYKIAVIDGKIFTAEIGICSVKDTPKVYDFIEESMCWIRFYCENQ